MGSGGYYIGFPRIFFKLKKFNKAQKDLTPLIFVKPWNPHIIMKKKH